MKPEERLAVLETKMAAVTEDLEEIKADLKALLAAANMGKGAWWVSVKIGAFILTLAGALAWIYDHLPR